MNGLSVKDEARRLVDRLPENATWDDLEYEIYVRRAIEAGIADSNAGNVMTTEEVRRSFGLPE
jgi:predicted transcriptional regulator